MQRGMENSEKQENLSFASSGWESQPGRFISERIHQQAEANVKSNAKQACIPPLYHWCTKELGVQKYTYF